MKSAPRNTEVHLDKERAFRDVSRFSKIHIGFKSEKVALQDAIQEFPCRYFPDRLTRSHFDEISRKALRSASATVSDLLVTVQGQARRG